MNTKNFHILMIKHKQNINEIRANDKVTWISNLSHINKHEYIYKIMFIQLKREK
jgi:hypothetical protein